MLLNECCQCQEDVIATLSGVPAALKKSLMRWLLSRGLGQDLETWVRERRAVGTSWDKIAEEMTATLGIPKDVTPVRRQTLQKWFPE